MGGFPTVPPNEGNINPQNILAGSQQFTVTTGFTALLSIPAGRVWQGNIIVSCSASSTPGSTVAGMARLVAQFLSPNAGATPLNGSTLFALQAQTSKDLAGDTVGGAANISEVFPMTLYSGVGTSAANLYVSCTIAGSAASIDITAMGSLV